jgi:tryptophan-rich sensory protein
MIPVWLYVGVVAFGLAFLLNRLSPRDLRWFNRLRRPPWLTFEWAIPFIWITIFITGAISATIAWDASETIAQGWGLMAGYILLEMTIMAYTPIMCQLRSLRVGTIIGATGFFVGLGLAIAVSQVSLWAVALLMPFLLWSPIGTYVTWAMIPLNPGEL